MGIQKFYHIWMFEISYYSESTFWQHNFTEHENNCDCIMSKSARSLACKNLLTIFFLLSSLYIILRETCGILNLGTMRSNRLRNCILLTDKQLKKKDRNICTEGG